MVFAPSAALAMPLSAANSSPTSSIASLTAIKLSSTPSTSSRTIPNGSNMKGLVRIPSVWLSRLTLVPPTKPGFTSGSSLPSSSSSSSLPRLVATVFRTPASGAAGPSVILSPSPSVIALSASPSPKLETASSAGFVG